MQLAQEDAADQSSASATGSSPGTDSSRSIASTIALTEAVVMSVSLAGPATIHRARPATGDAGDWTLFGRSGTDPGARALTLGGQDTS